MHDAETNLIQRNMNQIVSPLESGASLIDLGCGEGLKTIAIAEGAHVAGRDLSLYFVDISPHILDIAIENAARAGFHGAGLVEDFEDLDSCISQLQPSGQRLFYLGANVANFDPDHILSVIANSAQPNDLVYFSAQLSDHDPSQIIEEYKAPEVSRMFYATLGHLGLSQTNSDFVISFNSDSQRIEGRAVVKIPIQILEQCGVKVGDELLIFFSNKPNLASFQELAKRHFAGGILMFDDDRSKNYAAYLGKVQ
jgi:uncharacterized SAM-dependent methyltransferase